MRMKKVTIVSHDVYVEIPNTLGFLCHLSAAREETATWKS